MFITILGCIFILIGIGIYVTTRRPELEEVVITYTSREPWLTFNKGATIILTFLIVLALIIQSLFAYQNGYDDGYSDGKTVGARLSNRLAQCSEDEVWYPANFQPPTQAADLECVHQDEVGDDAIARTVIYMLVATGYLDEAEGQDYLNDLEAVKAP